MGTGGAEMRRLLILVSVIMLLATGLMIPTTPVAAAVDLSLGKVLWFNEDGSSSITIGPNGAADVWLGQIEYMCDTFYPIANVYVVAGTPVAGGGLVDVSGSPNVVIGSWGGGFSETIAYAKPSGKLGPGSYSVVYDECQNGVYDAGVDALFVDAITVVFPPGVLPPIDPAIAAIKGDAAISAIRARILLEGYRLYTQMLKAYELLQCLSGGIVSCAISQATDALKDYLMEQLRGSLGLVDVKEAALDLAEDVTLMYTGLAADPPDPDFRQPTVLGPVTNVQANDAGPFDQASATYANAMSVDAVLAEGLLHAVERYQGADAANDAAWARQHLTEARQYATLLADHQSVTNATLTELRNLIAADGRNFDGAAIAFEQNRTRVVAEGFSPAELALFNSRGMTAAQIDDLEVVYQELPSASGVTRAEIVARFDAGVASNTQWSNSLISFVGQLDSLEAVLANNVDAGGRPLPDAGGPYAVGVGSLFALNGGGASDPSGTITSAAWDTDLDTAFDDANGLSPSVTVGSGYDGLVGLRVVDDEGNPAVDYARLTVNDANDAPNIAIGSPPLGTVVVPTGGSQSFSVTPTDPDGDAVTGTWTVDGTVASSGSTFSFTDTAAFGSHTVRYTASDGAKSRGVNWVVSVVGVDGDADGWTSDVDCNDADAAINRGVPEIQGNAVDENCDGVVEPERNDPPVARNSAVGTPEDTAISFSLIAPDPENDPVAFVIAQPTNGVLNENRTASVTYTPNLDFVGTDTFAFTASDLAGLFSSATVTITVSALNDTPTAFPVSASGTEDGPAISVTLNATDAELSPLTYSPSTPSIGAFGGTAPNLTYAPPANFNGTVTFTYTASDSTLTSDPANGTIEIVPTNDAPTAADLTTTTVEDTAATITPTIGDIDVPADALTLVLVTPPPRGTVDVSGASFIYTPSPEFSGPDSFVYRVSDGDTVSPNRTITVNVTSVNDSPVSGDASAQLAEDNATWVVLPGSDPDSPLVFTITSQPTHGELKNLIGRRVLYEPDPEYFGPDSFQFQVTDGTTTVGPFTVSITVTEVNDPPTAIDDHAVTDGGDPIEVPVLTNDTDAEGTALSLLAVGQAEVGNAIIGAAGSIIVMPPLGYTGAINVPYTVEDAGGAASVATLTVLALDSSAPSHTFTEVGQFGVGDSFNVEQAGPNSLQVVSKAQAFNRIWVAVSTKGTIVKIDTDSGAILGEYRSAPVGDGQDPSRTTVDQNGNVWATNRASNTVVQIGSVENGQCVDRNGNGTIETSTAQNDIKLWPNTGGVDSNGGVDTALDECILKYIRVSSSGTRHVSVTEDNDIWVSGTGNRIFNLIDGDTGAIVRTEGPVGYGGYGGLIDSNGVIWSASYPAELLRWDTSLPLSGPAGGNWEVLPRGPAANNSYGTCIDLFGNVWVTELGSNTLKYAPDGTLLGTFPHGAGAAQGCAVDQNGDVWVAHSLLGYATVGHLTNEGVLVGNVSVGVGPTGISVDANGKVWSTNYYSGTVSRIDPSLGPVHAGTGKTVGAVDFTTVGLGGNPYNYSDMTGSTLQGLPVSGTWTATYDSGVAGSGWGGIDWHATVPGDATLEVRVAIGEDPTSLGSGSLVTDGSALSGTGQYAKVSVTFRRSGNGLSPVLHDVSLWTATEPPPAIASTEVSYETDEDVAIDVDLSAAMPPGAPAGTEIVPIVPTNHGSFTRINATTFRYTPNPDYNGTDMVLYRVDDGEQRSALGGAQILVNPVNDAPSATPASIVTDEDTPVTFSLTGTDPEGDPLTVIITDLPAHGTLTPAIGGAAPSPFTYTPNANFSGTDSLTFKVEDDPPQIEQPNRQSSTVTVNISVAPANDPPTATDASATTGFGTPVGLPLTGGDIDGDALTFQLVTGPSNGTVVITGATATYTPNIGFSGTDTFTFRSNDGTAGSVPATGTVTVNLVAAAPAVPPATPTTVPTPLPPAPPVQLPATGTDLVRLFNFGLMAAALGLGLVIATKRRRRAPPRRSD